MQADAKQTETKDALEALRIKFVHTRGADTDPTTTENNENSQFYDKNASIGRLKANHAHYKDGAIAKPTNDNPQSSFKGHHVLEDMKGKFSHAKEKDDTNPPEEDDFLASLKNKYAHQPTFLQAVEEMTESLAPLFADEVNGEFYKRAFLVMTEPERTISFRVNWTDDKGRIQTNRGWRVEFSRCVTNIRAVSILILMRLWLTIIFLPLPAHLDLTKGGLGSILL